MSCYTQAEINKMRRAVRTLEELLAPERLLDSIKPPVKLTRAEQKERKEIVTALKSANGSLYDSRLILKITIQSLRAKMKRYGIVC